MKCTTCRYDKYYNKCALCDYKVWYCSGFCPDDESRSDFMTLNEITNELILSEQTKTKFRTIFASDYDDDENVMCYECVNFHQEELRKLKQKN